MDLAETERVKLKLLAEVVGGKKRGVGSGRGRVREARGGGTRVMVYREVTSRAKGNTGRDRK